MKRVATALGAALLAASAQGQAQVPEAPQSGVGPSEVTPSGEESSGAGPSQTSTASLPPLTGGASLDRRAALERASIFYQSGNYAACIASFRELLESSRSSTGESGRQRARAHTYLAACLLASGNIEGTREQFRSAIREMPQMPAPDPVVFPRAVVDVFVDVRSRMMAALNRLQEEDLSRRTREAEQTRERMRRERERVAELERLAAEETLIERNARWMASVPFGLGQFNNDDDGLGWLFLTSEALLAASAIAATSVELGLHSRAEGGRSDLDPQELSQAIARAHDVGTISWLSLLVVASVGIVEANLSYEPERMVGKRRRPLPERLRSPGAPVGWSRVVSGPAWFGVSGSF